MTPILYDDLLYICSDAGVLAVYEADTGARVYQQRLQPGGYSASPVAADGRLYFANEDGDVTVVRTGRTFERLAVNRVGQLIMATPAISRGMIIFRSQHHLLSVTSVPGNQR